MNTITIRLVLFGAIFAVCLAAAGAETTPDACGHWEGKILIPEHELGIAVDLARNPQGAWIGSISVLGSSSIDIPLTSVIVEGAAVQFAADLPARASFTGHLADDIHKLAGVAANSEGEAPFQLTRDGPANVKLPPRSSELTKNFEGAWEGTIEEDGKVRRVGLHMMPAADGVATATLIARDHGSLKIPVTTVTIENMQLVLDVRAVSGRYRGTLGAGGEIGGEWSEGSKRVPLAFKRPSPAVESPERPRTKSVPQPSSACLSKHASSHFLPDRMCKRTLVLPRPVRAVLGCGHHADNAGR